MEGSEIPLEKNVKSVRKNFWGLWSQGAAGWSLAVTPLALHGRHVSLLLGASEKWYEDPL